MECLLHGDLQKESATQNDEIQTIAGFYFILSVAVIEVEVEVRIYSTFSRITKVVTR